MEFAGRYHVPAPPEDVWAAINDPEILKACIPGCQSMASQLLYLAGESI